MKINVESDCTPEEARTFLGLPDVAKANALAFAAEGASVVVNDIRQAAAEAVVAAARAL